MNENVNGKKHLSDRALAWIGVSLSLISLLITGYDYFMLDSTIVSQNDRLAEMILSNTPRLFHSTNQSKPLPVNRETTLYGTHSKIPANSFVRAALFLKGKFFVSPYNITFETTVDKNGFGKWSLPVNPGTKSDEWRLYICLTNDHGKEQMDKWRDKTVNKNNWDNWRPELPSGVVKNSEIPFKAVDY